ncbi:MAG: hypothetical protein K6A44_06195 [bacterium]|nr:hypothetical protein [bacterium]
MGIKVSEIKTEVCPTNSLETTKKVGTPKHDNIMVFPPQENTVLKKSENNEEPKSSVLPKILLASLGIFSGLVLTVAAKGPIRKFKNFRAIPKDLRGIF